MSTPVEKICRRLARFAEVEAAGASPLYEHLARSAAEDGDVAGLLADVEPERARPTLLFAAAHRLVLADPICELANYYPSVGGTYGVDAATWPMFREFVLARAERMRALLAQRTTQTNEVRRAASLYPAVALAAKQARGPVGLLEVGTSAGLLLGLDRYGYQYATGGGEQRTAGPARAALVLRAELECQDSPPPSLPKKVNVSAKVGLDRAPVDLTDDEALAWLEACIWADQPDRLRRLGLAAAAQRADRPVLVAGDAVDDLAAAAERVPAALPLVVLTSHTLVYLEERRRAEFVEALRSLAGRRQLWWVSQEAYQAGLNLVLPDRPDLAESVTDASPALFGTLGLVRFGGGEPHATALARTAGHGERLRWLG